MAKYVDVERIGDFERVKKQLESRWLELETTPNAFRYKLNIQRQKVITNGPYKVLVQVNRLEPKKKQSMAYKWL